jgi:hypothetical protein
VVFTVLLLPVTLVDRQLYTLFTKMIPRYQRSEIFGVCEAAREVAQHAQGEVHPDVHAPRWRPDHIYVQLKSH